MSDESIYQGWQRRIGMCKNRRILWEALVATCAHFAVGRHDVSWDRRGRMRERFTPDNEVNRTINLFSPALSKIVSRLIANDPRWNPVPDELEDVTDEEIDAADAALQKCWEGDEYGDFSVKQELKQVIRSGWLQGGRLAYFRFDEDSKMPVMDTYELWDVYTEASRRLRDKQWIVIAQTKDVDWIKSNGAYDATVRNEVAVDNRLAESGVKSQYERRIKGGSVDNGNTALLYYTFEVKSRDPKIEAEKQKSPNAVHEDDPGESVEMETPDGDNPEQEDDMNGKGKFYILFRVVCPQGVLQEMELDYPRLSAIFDLFKPVEDGEFYGIPPCADWIDPSKSIDKTNTNIENYIGTMLQGKWIRRNKTIAVPVADRMGQIITDETGNSITPLRMEPLPATHFKHKEDNERYFEKISGVHDVSQGGSTGGADSGVGIAQLVANDESNSADPVDNFRLFLQRCAKKLLRQMADHWSEVHTLYRYDNADMSYKQMKVVGEKFHNTDEASMTGVTKIRAFKRIHAQIEIGAFWKKSEERGQLVEIMKAGYNPGGNPLMDKIFLSTFTIGVGRQLVRQFKMLQNPWAYVAQGNVFLILNGTPPVTDPNAPHQFFQQFYTQKAEEQMKAGDQQGANLLNAAAQKEGILAQSIGGAGSPQTPETLDQLHPELQASPASTPGGPPPPAPSPAPAPGAQPTPPPPSAPPPIGQ